MANVRQILNRQVSAFSTRELNQIRKLLRTQEPVVLNTATVSIKPMDHEDKTLVLDRAAGVTATLPAASGSGAKYRFVIKTTVTSNSYIVEVANASDTMQGHATLHQDAADTVATFDAASTSDTITLNGSTTGGLLGGVIECEDVAANKWQVSVVSAATGVEATPFSAAVS